MYITFAKGVLDLYALSGYVSPHALVVPVASHFVTIEELLEAAVFSDFNDARPQLVPDEIEELVSRQVHTDVGGAIAVLR